MMIELEQGEDCAVVLRLLCEDDDEAERTFDYIHAQLAKGEIRITLAGGAPQLAVVVP